MRSKRKYIAILILALAAMLCMVGASMWIVTSPTSISPKWAKLTPVYFKRVVEYDYTDGGISLTEKASEIAETVKNSALDANGDPVDASAIGSVAFETDVTATNGDANELTNGVSEITVGSTYSLSNLQVTLGDGYYFAGTYLDSPKTDTAIKVSGAPTTYAFSPILKYKTARIVTRNADDNNAWNGSSDWETWYTVEDALDRAAANSNSSLETTVFLAGKAVIDPTTKSTAGSTVETSFTKLSDSLTGYSSACRTVKAGVTLLLPVADHDNQIEGVDYALTSGTIGPYSGGLQADGFLVSMLLKDVAPTGDLAPIPHTYNLPTPLYARLTVPSGIVLINNGTTTVGGISGAGQGGTTPNGHLNRITGNYSELKLEGAIQSHGVLNAYGNIVGSGSIAVQEGTVRERFETLGWPSGQTFLGRYIGNQSLSATQLLGNNEIALDNPNEFPVEDYQLVAIGVRMTVSYQARYLANFRIFIGSQKKSAAGQTITTGEQFAIADFAICDQYRNDEDAEGVFLLRSGATLTKTLSEPTEKTGQRMTFTINGGAYGGCAKIKMNVMVATFTADTTKVKFPVSSNLDLVLQNGNYQFHQGYEFMGPTSLGYNSGDNNDDGDPTDNGFSYRTTGATLTLENNATLDLENSRFGGNGDEEDGIIFYDGSKVTVGSNCTLKLGGAVGGTSFSGITAQRGATLITDANLKECTGYIGGSGAVDLDVSSLSANVTFTGTPIVLSAGGNLYQHQNEYASGNFAAGLTYRFDGTGWVGDNAEFGIQYKFYYRDADGTLHAIDDGLVSGNGNPSVYHPGDGTINLDANGLTYSRNGEVWTFVGWYTDENCTRTTTFFDARNFGEKTFYGLFEPGNVYIFTFDTHYNTLSADGSLVPSTEASSVNYSVGRSSSSHLADYIESLSASGAMIYREDEDAHREYYFDGWYLLKDGVTLPLRKDNIDPIADQDIGITVYAVWKLKATIEIRDAEFEKDGGSGNVWHYKPDAEISLTDLFDPRQYDNDNSRPTYFAGWSVDAAYESYLDTANDLFTVPSENVDGVTITITANRGNKVKVRFTDTAIGYTSAERYYRAGTSARVPSDYDSKNDDTSVETYLFQWKRSDTGETFTTFYTIPEGTEATEIVFEADRKSKVAITFKDEVGGTGTGYFTPNSAINDLTTAASSVGVDPTKKDYDITFQTYFDGTWYLEGSSDAVMTPYIVSGEIDANGEPKVKNITFETQRIDKVVVTVLLRAYGSSCTASATLTASDTSTNVKDSVQGTGRKPLFGSDSRAWVEKEMKAYLRPGQTFTITTTHSSNFLGHNCEGIVTCDDSSVTCSDSENGHNHQASGTADHDLTVKVELQ